MHIARSGARDDIPKKLTLMSLFLQVITSFCPQGGSAEALALIASTTQPQRHGRPSQFQIKIPKVDGYFTGTGMYFLAAKLATTGCCTVCA